MADLIRLEIDPTIGNCTVFQGSQLYVYGSDGEHLGPVERVAELRHLRQRITDEIGQ